MEQNLTVTWQKINYKKLVLDLARSLPAPRKAKIRDLIPDLASCHWWRECNHGHENLAAWLNLVWHCCGTPQLQSISLKKYRPEWKGYILWVGTNFNHLGTKYVNGNSITISNRKESQEFPLVMFDYRMIAFQIDIFGGYSIALFPAQAVMYERDLLQWRSPAKNLANDQLELQLLGYPSGILKQFAAFAF